MSKPIIDSVLDWMRAHDIATFFILVYLFAFVVGTTFWHIVNDGSIQHKK